MTKTLQTGNGSTGYHSAEVKISKDGKAALVAGTVLGDEFIIARCIKAHNAGQESYFSRVGDEFPFTIT